MQRPESGPESGPESQTDPRAESHCDSNAGEGSPADSERADSALADGALAEQLSTLAGHLSAGTARLLELIAEFDRREVWAAQGARSCAHWLGWACGIDAHTAREKVRTARALSGLPLLNDAFARGELSYARVRALTRIATPDNEADLLGFGLAGTVAHVETLVRQYRRALQLAEEEGVEEVHRERALHGRYDDEGGYVLHGRFTAETGAHIEQALEALVEMHGEEQPAVVACEHVAESVAEAGPESYPQGVPHETPWSRLPLARRRADAFAWACERLFDVGEAPPLASLQHEVVVHVDLSVLMAACADEHSGETDSNGNDAGDADPGGNHSGDNGSGDDDGHSRQSHGSGSHGGASTGGTCHLADGPALMAETARRLCCDGGLRTMVDGIREAGLGEERLRAAGLGQDSAGGHGAGGNGPGGNDFFGDPLGVGRRTRAVPPALRRALQARDHHTCRFPGCTGTYRLHAHHVQHWANGGETTLGNLVLLCPAHHRLVHEGGFDVRPDADGTFRFFDPHGEEIVPPAPLHPPDLGELMARNEDHAIDADTAIPDWDGQACDYSAMLQTLLARRFGTRADNC